MAAVSRTILKRLGERLHLGDRRPHFAPTPDDEEFYRICIAGVSAAAEAPPAERLERLLDLLGEGRYRRALSSQALVLLEGFRRIGIPQTEPRLRRMVALSLREAMRGRLVQTHRDALCEALAQARIPAAELRGPQFSARYYGSPAMRHTHALRLLVEAPRFAEVTTVAAGLGWNGTPRRHPRFAAQLVLSGDSRPDLHIQSRLLPSTQGDSAFAAGPVDPATQFAEILGASSYELVARSGRWACDLAAMMGRDRPDAAHLAGLIETHNFAADAGRQLDRLSHLLPDAAGDERAYLESVRVALAAAGGAPRALDGGQR